MACHLQIDADQNPVPDPAYHSDADLDADPGFYLMRKQIRRQIQVIKMIRIHEDPDPQYFVKRLPSQSFSYQFWSWRWRQLGPEW
jgi:hypothetical protein